MKKRILLVALALIMCLSVALTSCNKKVSELKFSEVFQSVPSEEPEFLSSYSTISLQGNSVKSGYIFVATEQQMSDYYTEVRVYNLAEERCVLTLTESQTGDMYTNYYFHFISDECFAVLKESYSIYNSTTSSNYSSCFNMYPRIYGTYTVEIYNQAGTKLDSADLSSWQSYSSYFDDYYRNQMRDYVYNNNESSGKNDFVYEDTTLYKYDEDGNRVFVRDFGIEFMPSLSALQSVGDYYYTIDESYNSITVQVYNNELRPVANYAFPTYANFYHYDYDEALISFFPLGTDRILIQYAETLHQDAKDYDFRAGTTGKYDLITVVFNLSNNTVTELKNVNYKVREMICTTMKDADEDYLQDTVQNIAMITYIDENKHLDMSATNYDIVGISNDGKITANIVIEGCIASLPVPYGEDLFSAPSATEDNMYYIYNAQGEIVSYRALSNTVHGDYIYTDLGIYDLNGSKVYDLENKEVAFLNGGTALIYTTGGTNNDYYVFYNGNAKFIATVGEGYSAVNALYFNEYNEYDEYDSYFYTYKAYENSYTSTTTYTYTYYNAKGDVIGTFDHELSYVAESEDFLILKSSSYNNYTGTTDYTYYKFTMGK